MDPDTKLATTYLVTNFIFSNKFSNADDRIPNK